MKKSLKTKNQIKNNKAKEKRQTGLTGLPFLFCFLNVVKFIIFNVIVFGVVFQ